MEKNNFPHNYIEVTLMDGTFYRLNSVQKVLFRDRMPFGEKDDFSDASGYLDAIQCDAVMESDNDEAIPKGTWVKPFERNGLLERPKANTLDSLRAGGHRGING